jgi:hypothetical protein
MMNHILLLDVAPEPVSVGIGIAGLILVAVVVLMLTAAVLVGAVFLFKRIRTTSERSSRVVVGDVSLNLDNAASQARPQPQSSPNQP